MSFPFSSTLLVQLRLTEEGSQNSQMQSKIQVRKHQHTCARTHTVRTSVHTRARAHARTHTHTLAPVGGCGFASHEGSRPCGQIPAHDCRSVREASYGHGRRLPPETSGMESDLRVRRVSGALHCARPHTISPAIVVWGWETESQHPCLLAPQVQAIRRKQAAVTERTVHRAV